MRLTIVCDGRPGVNYIVIVIVRINFFQVIIIVIDGTEHKLTVM